MTISTFAAYVAAKGQPYQRIIATKKVPAMTSQHWYSMWLATPNAGAAPTASVVPTNATTGAMKQIDSSGTQRILSAIAGMTPAVTATAKVGAKMPGAAIIMDRLVHSGGLSGTAAGAQTTNLPTAALTRRTSGAGVCAGAEIYTAIGTGGGTATISYTNSDPSPASGRTSPAFSLGVANFAAISRLVRIPLQQGTDKGVTAVASLTLSGTTGTAGNFGITLYHECLVLPFPLPGTDALLDLGQIPAFDNGACLFTALVMSVTNVANTSNLNAALSFCEDQ